MHHLVGHFQQILDCAADPFHTMLPRLSMTAAAKGFHGVGLCFDSIKIAHSCISCQAIFCCICHKTTAWPTQNLHRDPDQDNFACMESHPQT